MKFLRRLQTEPVATVGAVVVVLQNVLATLVTHFPAYVDAAQTVLVIVGALVARSKVTPVNKLPVAAVIPFQTNAAGIEDR